LKFDFSELTKTKNISFKQVIEEKPIKIYGDPEMFRTIMANLIDNAIKYSPEGGEVLISTQTENGFVEFSVKDTGIGIPPKYISRIYERFFRVDKARSRDVGGTGLGLSIVKHMAELQQAKYGVESELDVGSRFWVKFKKAN
jgi:two-component system phosphate regulon sensor histidine kinase PhoR